MIQSQKRARLRPLLLEVQPDAEPHTLQYGACSVCGYNTNNLQIRPGTEVILEQ